LFGHGGNANGNLLMGLMGRMRMMGDGINGQRLAGAISQPRQNDEVD
jgi:hypothetical protein